MYTVLLMGKHPKRKVLLMGQHGASVVMYTKVPLMGKHAERKVLLMGQHGASVVVALQHVPILVMVQNVKLF